MKIVTTSSIPNPSRNKAALHYSNDNEWLGRKKKKKKGPAWTRSNIGIKYYGTKHVKPFRSSVASNICQSVTLSPDEA